MSIPQQVINLSLTAFDTTLLQSNNACAVPHVTSIPLPWHRSIAVSTSLIIMAFIEQTNFVRTYTYTERERAIELVWPRKCSVSLAAWEQLAAKLASDNNRHPPSQLRLRMEAGVHSDTP